MLSVAGKSSFHSDSLALDVYLMCILKLCCREILGKAEGLTLSMCLGVWSFASGEELKMIPVLKGLWNRGMVELLTVAAKQEGRSWEERRDGFDTLIFHLAGGHLEKIL